MKKFYIILMLPVTFVLACSKSKPADVTPTPTSQVVTYAGNGTSGLLNGSTASAEFNLPQDVLLISSGIILVAEQGNNDIRALTVGGQVVTFAGDGTPGYKEGAAAAAQFNNPQGMVNDGGGNIYVADAGNNVIRRITTGGQVSTYAGSGTAGYKDGDAASAQFTHPCGLAIDKAGNVYVADLGNNVIRKISNKGVVTTYAGTGSVGVSNGGTSVASFHSPAGLAIDASNNLYVSEGPNNAIRMITTEGQVSTYATLNAPLRVVADPVGTLYISTSDNFIKMVVADGTGNVTTYAGNGAPGFGDGTLTSAEFNLPVGVSVNSSGALVVADYLNNRIRLVQR